MTQGWAPAESVAIEVEDLGDPTPPPFGDEGDQDQGPSAGAAPAPLGLSPADIADRLVPLIRTPFSIAGLAISRRYPPGDFRTAAVELWQVSEAEARPIAEALAPVIPAHWLVERALGASPWGAAGVQLYQLTTARLDGTTALASAWEAQHGSTARAPDTNGAGPPSGDGAATRTVPADDSRDGFEGAGLGLGAAS